MSLATDLLELSGEKGPRPERGPAVGPDPHPDMEGPKLTPRELVLRAFDPKPKGRVEGLPVGVCLGGSWPFFLEKVPFRDLLADPKRAAAIFYGVNARVGADFVTVGTGATALLLQALGAEICYDPRRAPSIETTLVSSEADIGRLDVQKALSSEGIRWLGEVARETVRLNAGRRALFVSGRAPFTLAGQMTELEVFSKGIYKNKAFVERLLDKAEELSAGYFEHMLSVKGLDGIFVADPSASGDLLSARHFELVALPRIKGLLDRLKTLGKPSLLHICGKTTDRLHLLPKTGVGMVSLDSKVDLAKGREILGGKLAFAGNVHPVFVLEDLSPGGVAEATLRCLVEARAAEGGFMLLPGCDLSARVPEANVASFVRVAHDFRG
ncbi:MAG: hypothetical protein LBL95_01190 [Deltaproteobacteria bacterium]|nr:hypothetical protein [Deltaproteobacteria bacterium]